MWFGRLGFRNFCPNEHSLSWLFFRGRVISSCLSHLPIARTTLNIISVVFLTSSFSPQTGECQSKWLPSDHRRCHRGHSNQAWYLVSNNITIFVALPFLWWNAPFSHFCPTLYLQRSGPPESDQGVYPFGVWMYGISPRPLSKESVGGGGASIICPSPPPNTHTWSRLEICWTCDGHVNVNM